MKSQMHLTCTSGSVGALGSNPPRRPGPKDRDCRWTCRIAVIATQPEASSRHAEGALRIESRFDRRVDGSRIPQRCVHRIEGGFWPAITIE